ncbi:MAG TPA: glycoside hydrolase family 88 protein [Bacteroidales bacterium]|nr:glycoside hydrolase family 88 protein [Bacteroidales bacterium]
MKYVLYTSLILLISCSSGSVPRDGKADLWSIKTANSVMAHNDSLMFYNGVKKIKWQYDIAMLGMAIDKLGGYDRKYSRYMEDYINYFIRDDGTILKYKMSDYNLDNINPAKNLITLYKRTGNEKYNHAIEVFIDQLINQPTTPQGGFWHKKIYPDQMWLDGIYMSSPYMAQFAAEFNQPEWFDTLSYQIRLIYSKTRDPETGLLYHAWDESKTEKWCNPETGQSTQFWGRGMGWFLMALADDLDYLPEDHPDRDTLLQILRNTADAVLKVRDPETKLWYQVLDQGGREGNYLEASASAMFVYAMARAANKNYLGKKYGQIARESFRAIVDNFIQQSQDGVIMTHICGPCGLGGKPYRNGSYDYYVNVEQVNNDPKGVAPFIMAAIELRL